MTNEEAKSRINTLLEIGGSDGFDYKDIKALEMAIKALNREVNWEKDNAYREKKWGNDSK